MGRWSTWALRIAFGLALLATLGFGIRFGASVIYWANPANSDQPVEGWMPVGFVARSWHVPTEVLVQALELGPDERARQTLEQIARHQGVPVAELVATLEAAIRDWRATRNE